jgi:hypothetical protein
MFSTSDAEQPEVENLVLLRSFAACALPVVSHAKLVGHAGMVYRCIGVVDGGRAARGKHEESGPSPGDVR